MSRISSRPAPAEFFWYRSPRPFRFELKTMRVPSGDHTGASSNAESNVRRVVVPPVWSSIRGEHLYFALESREALGIKSKDFREDLDRHVAIQPRVVCAIASGHPAGSNQLENFIGAETRS